MEEAGCFHWGLRSWLLIALKHVMVALESLVSFRQDEEATPPCLLNLPKI